MRSSFYFSLLSAFMMVTRLINALATMETFPLTNPSTTKPPETPQMSCSILDEQLLTCDCKGIELTEENVRLAFSGTEMEKDQFQRGLHSIQTIDLSNCPVVNSSHELITSMYYLTEFIFTDCSNLPQYIFSLLERNFEQGSFVEDDHVKLLRIEYTQGFEASDKWPSSFSLMASSSNNYCDSSTTSLDYDLQRLELINIPGLKSIDPCMFVHFPYMKYLDISRNNFEKSFPNVSAWKDLQLLRCRFCKLEDIPTNDLIPSNLEVLDFSMNQITNTDPCYGFDHPSKCGLVQNQLGYLDLAFNKLKFFQQNTFEKVKFKVSEHHDLFRGKVVIDISNNRLKTLSYEAISSIDKNKDKNVPVIINANENRFYCNCYMLYARDEVLKSSKIDFWGMCESTLLEDYPVMNLNRNIPHFKTCDKAPSEIDQGHQSLKVFGEVVLGLTIVAIVVVFTLFAHSYLKNRATRSRGHNTDIVTNYRHMRMNQGEDPTLAVDVGRNDDDVFAMEGPTSHYPYN